MRLERLEIAGFKSFSDRAELAFDRGVTAIVGPNGCGKSNVADAITWVLGEQSAKSLRGDRMEDVIFSGSDARRPGAAAEVRLRLSGLASPARPGLERDQPTGHAAGLETAGASDAARSNGNGNGNGYHHQRADEVQALMEDFVRDVEVTRRLYRSGESEYLIDGEVCRLRDVHELLMDTGLGAKAYSIIEQGKIGMILSSRPADRRQLIEEAAGITKYKSRRRAAELKLEAAQQNLTRIDDIVFEVEKQRGALKRQAAKARRYRRLREELRRWEKVLFARRYRELAHGIETARARLTQARERETLAVARLAEVEADLGRLRIQLAEGDTRAARIREDGHACELGINRRQQQLEFSRHQAESLGGRAAEIDQEIGDLDARREPARLAIESRRQASLDAGQARDEAEAVRSSAGEDLARAQQQIEGLEAEVEAARAAVYAALSSVSALRHAVQHAGVQRDRVGGILAKLDVEEDDLRREHGKVDVERTAAIGALERATGLLEGVRVERSTRESDLAAARADHDARARETRAREQELVATEARLASLEELAASRAEFGDAARMVLVQANGSVDQRGAVADYLEVEGRYERAVEACVGDLLQHVIVERHEQAAAGLGLVREAGAGRCGFVVVDGETGRREVPEPLRVPGVRPLSDVVRVTGPYAATIASVLPDAYVTATYDEAVGFSRQTRAAVATCDGDVLRGPNLVSGGAKVEGRGILATRREIKELRERVVMDRQVLAGFGDELARLQAVVAQTTGSIAALLDEQHRLEIAVVGHEAQLARVEEEGERLARKAEVIGLEKRAAEEERVSLDARRAEAETSIERFEASHRQAEGELGAAQRRLGHVRDAVAQLGGRAAEAGAAHAALVERASALEGEVARLEEGARDLEERLSQRRAELEQTRARREGLVAAIAEGTRAVDEEIRVLDALRETQREADDAVSSLRSAVDEQDVRIRDARHGVEEVRTETSSLEVTRATAEADLAHLAQSCLDSVQLPLDDVLAEVEVMEQSGQAVPDAAALAADEPDADGDEGDADGAAAAPAPAAPPVEGSMSAEEAIAALRGKIDRLGPVNMMAIEQFDELETRHGFLTTQRKDLVESIAQTSEAIRRIDETSKARFSEAFAAIQANFQITFATLFGGGHAGLTLLDENDPLESGIDIIASPPGKRLQSVQLLSGGEKALTAIALMFAIFRYKPSPFCLLDEIDAPLDDANVGRFVEMLRGMLDRTQFILITHNRRTMEIANRLYGVTMEEPGVSKLISVSLN